MLLPERILIRPACREDLDSIVAFSAALAMETEGRRLDQTRLIEGTRALLDIPNSGFFLVAELPSASGNRLVGQLMVTCEWSDWRNGVFWWIQSVYVAPPWRRQGIYRAMHDHVVAKAKGDPQVCGIRLYVERDNAAAQTVYQKVGLVPSGYIIYEQDFVLGSRSTSVRDR